MSEQQGDVLLFQTVDGGDINVVGGITEMSSGLETAGYLSLFGGNEDDSGRDNDPFNWWGNLSEIDPVNHYRSETQHLLQSLPLTSGNLQRIEDAATRDLAWFITVGAAAEITVAASIPALNRIRIAVNIDGEPALVFEENWKAAVA